MFGGRPLIVACLLCTALGSAASAAPRVRMGVGGGLNLAQLTHQSDFFDIEPNYRPAWYAGLVLNARLGSRFSLATGARYIEYCDRIVFTITDGSGGWITRADSRDRVGATGGRARSCRRGAIHQRPHGPDPEHRG